MCSSCLVSAWKLWRSAGEDGAGGGAAADDDEADALEAEEVADSARRGAALAIANAVGSRGGAAAPSSAAGAGESARAAVKEVRRREREAMVD